MELTFTVEEDPKEKENTHCFPKRSKRFAGVYTVVT